MLAKQACLVHDAATHGQRHEASPERVWGSLSRSPDLVPLDHLLFASLCKRAHNRNFPNNRHYDYTLLRNLTI